LIAAKVQRVLLLPSWLGSAPIVVSKVVALAAPDQYVLKVGYRSVVPSKIYEVVMIEGGLS
jgi:hypothetical protein